MEFNMTKEEADKLMTLLIRENVRIEKLRKDDFTVKYFGEEQRINRNLWSRLYDLRSKKIVKACPRS